MLSIRNVCTTPKSITRALSQETPHTGNLSRFLLTTFVWPAMAVQIIKAWAYSMLQRVRRTRASRRLCRVATLALTRRLCRARTLALTRRASRRLCRARSLALTRRASRVVSRIAVLALATRMQNAPMVATFVAGSASRSRVEPFVVKMASAIMLAASAIKLAPTSTSTNAGTASSAKMILITTTIYLTEGLAVSTFPLPTASMRATLVALKNVPTPICAPLLELITYFWSRLASFIRSYERRAFSVDAVMLCMYCK